MGIESWPMDRLWVKTADPWITHGSRPLILLAYSHPSVNHEIEAVAHRSPMDRPWVPMTRL